LLVLKSLVDLLFGIPCPACSCWTLRRLARTPTHYRCNRCGMRFKRYGFGPWQDASGPADEAYYSSRRSTHRWLGYTKPQPRGDTTTGVLLKSHRQRENTLPCPGPVETPLIRWKAQALGWLGLAHPQRPGETTTGSLLDSQRRRRSLATASGTAQNTEPRTAPDPAASQPPT
jgi:hypothetical protein